MIITFWNIESRNERRDEGTRRKDRKKEKKEQRYAKALMIFRALTVCHLHDDNGQL